MVQDREMKATGCRQCNDGIMVPQKGGGVTILSEHPVERVRKDAEGRSYAALTSGPSGSYVKGLMVQYMVCEQCGCVALFAA